MERYVGDASGFQRAVQLAPTASWREGNTPLFQMLENIGKTLGELLAETRPAVLFEAMRHAVMSGGKRVRPQICLAAAMAVGGKAEDAIFPACAIELLHSYTLVHDDLPSMDNDTERRGKPTVWAKYGEANAVLAGDALQSLAFRAAAMAPRNAGRIVAELAEAGVGVVRGQVEDIDGDDVDFIYRHKTADLFIAAAAMGAHAGGGSDADVDRLRSYALNLGLAFQFEDDLLDGDSPYSREETERKVAEHTSAAVAALEGLPGDVSHLASLAERLVGRSV
ncbi:MAG: polyprenyl synthetase family protein [Lentisphaerae bacterium]|nr:polyprenyl synthetase family protein [Lentisphaerota bacterium]